MTILFHWSRHVMLKLTVHSVIPAPGIAVRNSSPFPPRPTTCTPGVLFFFPNLPSSRAVAGAGWHFPFFLQHVHRFEKDPACYRRVGVA